MNMANEKAGKTVVAEGAKGVRSDEKLAGVIAKVAAAEKAYDDAKAELTAAVQSVPVGYIFQMNDEPYEVARRNEEKFVKSVYTARQRAIMRGEPVPEVKTRVRKAKENGLEA